jgi:hypothetical protein
MNMDDLWYISLQECRHQLENCINYGYGLDERRIKKGLKVIEKTVERHRQSMEFWQELYCYKLLTDQGYHRPIYTYEPRWEQEIMYEWWRIFFSYGWQGAKTDSKPMYIER